MPSIWDTPGQQTQTFNAQPYGESAYYQPGNTYGADASWYDTPLSGMIREQSPQVAYAQYGSNQGIADNDQGFNRWFYQQYPRFQRAYGMATLQNPLITIDEFMKTLPGVEGLQRQYQALSPGARGMDYRNYSPVSRWIGR